MDGENGEIVQEVAGVVRDAEHAEVVAEIAVASAEVAIADANERVEHAQELATDIAAAAMETERGREIQALKEEVYKWRGEQEEARRALEELKSEFSNLREAMASLTTLQLVAPNSTASLSLTPDQSAVTEAVETMTEVLPENLQSVVDENPEPVPPAPRRVKRWI